ncbi:2-dehydropantoate 2-reductase [Sporomusa termitida]|uniref:2-dehydropantoate 2-reductase n=2 Tax=Sporomusa termitida TaxID=2377 RepID=A0A517DSE4_9FIRM|nr:2-dehydropantoate 2-reductase [Sporomusa termitida]
MRTAILGCGAMGTVLGAYMNKNGHETILIDNYMDHVKALNERGARIIRFADLTVPVRAITPDQMEGKYDLVFLFTKQTVNKEVLTQLLPFLNADSTVCTLQNGVPEPSVAEIVGKERTVGGTVLWGATFIEPGVSELTSDITKDSLFEIGEMDGVIGDRIKKVAKALEKMGPVIITDNLMGARWLKVMLNSCWSGMSASLGCTFGDIIDNPKASACMSYIAQEAVAICKTVGYTMPPFWGNDVTPMGIIDTEEEFKNSQMIFYNIISNSMRPAKASMLQDLEKGKLTEVGMINGFICDEGKKVGIATPFNDTVVKVVRGIEAGDLPISMDNLKYFDVPRFK